MFEENILYLYEDHQDSRVKHLAVKAVSFLRRATSRMPAKLVYIIACIMSPFMVLLYSWPAKLFKRCKGSYRLYQRMPFNFGTSLFSLSGDIYDRLSAPVELRFNPQKIHNLLLWKSL